MPVMCLTDLARPMLPQPIAQQNSSTSLPGASCLTSRRERLNKEVKRRADVVGIFPNEDSITRLIGAVLLEANDEWQLQPRYMQVEGMAELAAPQTDEMPQLQITPKAA